MRAFPLPPCDAAQVQRQLFCEHLVEVPLMVWNDRQFVRVSLQAYNTPDDTRRLVDGLAELLGESPARR
jgi:isopenicillin-N epimerase